MNTPRRRLGLEPADLIGKPYARFWNPTLAPLTVEAREALARDLVAPPLLPSLADAPRLLAPGYGSLESGLCLAHDGALHVAIRTEMPDVSPHMIDWWFGWHSEEPQRYKLWHPQAHVHAEWRTTPPPDSSGRARYVGQVSRVDEYLGSMLGRYAISFIPPAELGLAAPSLDDARQGTAVCARVGFADVPIDFGYLVHHVRRVAGGSEMRSRFWVGGPYVGGRDGETVGRLTSSIAGLVKRPTAMDGRNLLVHCAQEMAHLASFLPALYGELSGDVSARPALRAI